MQKISIKEIDSLNRQSSEIFQDDLEKSIQFAEKAQLFSVHNNYKKGHADSLINQARDLMIRSEYVLADKHYNKAKSIFEFMDDIEGQLKANSGLSDLYYLIGNFDECLKLNIDIIETALEKGFLQEHIKALISNTEVFIELDDLKRALESSITVLILGEKLDNFVQEPNVLKTMSDIYLKMDDIQNGLNYLKKAYKLFQELNEIKGQTECLCSFGKIYAKKNDFENAEKHFLESIELAKDSPLEDDIYYETAHFYFDNKDYVKSLHFLKKSYRIAKKRDSKNCMRKTFMLLSRIGEKKKDTANAFLYLKEYYKLDRLVNVEESYRRLENLDVRLKIEKVRKDNEQLIQLNTVLKKISKISQGITSTLDPREIINIVYKNIKSLMDLSSFGLAIYHDDSKEVEYKIFIENSKIITYPIFSLDDKSSFACWSIRNNKDVFISDIKNENKKYIDEEGHLGKINNSLIYKPLYSNDKIIAVLTIQSQKRNAYNKRDITVLELLCPYIAIAIQNSREYNRVTNLNSKTDTDNETNHELSHIDFLTDLHNRRYFHDVIKTGYLQQITRKSLSFMTIDIDYFRVVNFENGKSVGDTILKQFCHRIKDFISNDQVLIRWSGEEFLLLVQGYDNLEIKQLADRLLKNVSNSLFCIGSIEIKLTISIGFLHLNSSDTRPETFKWSVVTNLIEQATRRAKTSGRNCAIGFTTSKTLKESDFVSIAKDEIDENIKKGLISLDVISG